MSSSTPDTTAGTTTGDSTPTSEPGDLSAIAAVLDRTWAVQGTITVGGPRPAPVSDASITFVTDGAGQVRIDVRTGCNSGSATITGATADTFDVGPLALTKRACIDPALQAVESQMINTLSGTVDWSLDGDDLAMSPRTISDTGLQLRDTASSPTTEPPTTDLPTTTDTTPSDSTPASDDLDRLLATRWLVESALTVGGLETLPAGASIEFDGDGQILVRTGCNSGSAPVTFDDADGTFTVGPLTLTEIGCSGEIADLEVRVVAQLAMPLVWSIRDDLLTVFPLTITDTGLQLRAG